MKTISQICREQNVTRQTMYHLRNKHQGKKGSKTTNLQLAVEAAKRFGGRPIDYVSDSVKSLALSIHPELNTEINEFQLKDPKVVQ